MFNRRPEGFFSTRTGKLSEVTEPESYKRSDDIRQWLVLMALAGNDRNTSNDLTSGLAHAFARACHGVQSGQIELDYHPANGETLDIPHVGHPLYMQALLYWSSQIHCTLGVLAEMHATLGSSPTLQNASTAARHIEHEAVITRSWLYSSRRRRIGAGDTVPMFQKTDFQRHH